MGIFKRTTAAPSDAKARAGAVKAGASVEGAVYVGEGAEDSRTLYLIVHPDRVELHRGRGWGSVTRSGSGAQVVPTARVSSVVSVREGIWQVVTVYTSGSDLRFKCDVKTGAAAEAAIRSVL